MGHAWARGHSPRLPGQASHVGAGTAPHLVKPGHQREGGGHADGVAVPRAVLQPKRQRGG